MSARAASRGGADRVELCCGLQEGGLTPSEGLMKAVLSLPDIAVNILIRPRGGDFLYSPEEKQIILNDIRRAGELGANGVVVGALNADGTIDGAFVERCVREAGAMSVTFHRAFDVCRDPNEALEELIGLGCNRILTSGCAPSVYDGIELISRLVEKANERIIIMPGCGVKEWNAAEILRRTGATEIHTTASVMVKSATQYRTDAVKMGNPDIDEYTIKETSEETVRAIRREIDAV